jgi:uracil-DNA glycosylase family 4
MFTGDRSGDWLYRALHRAGFANQKVSTDCNDGLKLINCAITNICRCAPPDNKPARDELENCSPYFTQTIELCQPRVIVALGGLAWKATLSQLFAMSWSEPIRPLPKFSHGSSVRLKNQRWLIGSYHPSQQNTFTGRLTEPMLDQIFRKSKKLIAK